LRLRIGESFARERIPFSAPRLEIRGTPSAEDSSRQCARLPEKTSP
jgi:hypothetical protein